jgi:chitodextrinase
MNRYRLRLPVFILTLFALHLSYLASYAAIEPDRVASSLNKTDIGSMPQALQAAFSAAAGHDDSAYAIGRTGKHYHGSNAGHNLSMDFSSGGVTIHSGTSEWGLRLKKIGYGNNLTPLPSVLPKGKVNRIEYAHEGSMEWYVNGPLGLEQGFTIDRAPGEREGLLTLELSTAGDLRAAVEGNGSGVLLSGKDGNEVLRYSGLQALDATGRQLRTWLELDGLRLLVRVDDSGAQYPVVVDPLIQPLKLSASDGAARDFFGNSVALSADGNTALIGAYTKNSDQGAAFVFTRFGSTWSQQQELTASDGVGGDFFAWSVVLSADGNTALVGAYGRNSDRGAAYVFMRSGSTWSQQQELTAPAGAAEFGSSVAVSADGSTALIGASGTNAAQGAAYVFTRAGSTWSQQQELTTSGAAQDQFGSSVTMSADGNTALIGAPGTNSRQGAAYVFTRSGSIWSQQVELTASDGAAGDNFGSFSVTLSADGNTALIGAPTKNSWQGAGYVFTRSGSIWSQQVELTASDGASASNFGVFVTLSADGSTALIGADDKNSAQGAAYVFTRYGSTWSWRQEVTAFDGASGDDFGGSVALSADGNTAIIGAIGTNSWQGAAYVFNNPGPAITFISDLNWTSATNGWGPVEKDMSNGEQYAGDGHTISLQGNKYAKGLGVHAKSVVTYNLGGQYSSFVSDIGIDDETSGTGSVEFQVWGDGTKLYDSGIMTAASGVQNVNVNVAGVITLQLIVLPGNGMDGDHADWAGASLVNESSGSAPPPDTTPPSVPGSLTATAVSSSEIDLTWSASTDNVGVTGYKIYRNGSTSPLALVTTGTSYADKGLTAATTYTYTVSAYDAAGNESAQSALPVSATTLLTGSGGVYITDLTWTSATNGWGPVEKDMSNGESAAGDGHEITVDGVKYTKGLGCHAKSVITYNLAGKYTSFLSDIGIDDEVLSEGGGGSVEFQVWGDGKKLYDSGTTPYITSGQPTQHVNVSVAGVNTLTLEVLVGSSPNNDHADWAGAYLVTGSAPPPDTTPPSVPGSLTATAVSSSEIDLTWSASTDNVGVTGYKIYRNGSTSPLALVTTGTSYADKGLTAATTYTYTVSAYDAAGNESAQPAPPVSATTLLTGRLTLQNELTASDGAASNWFGFSVALSADGNTALTGAWGSGKAYVFTRSAGSTWTQQQELTASDAATGEFGAATSQFGFSVALSADGNTALIGAWGSGKAYVFTRSGSTWTQQQELTASDGVGNGFGSSVALSADGGTALVTAPYKNSFQGVAYVFTRSGSTWTQQQELTASDGAAASEFGNSVALSGDGSTALIGADNKNIGTNSYQGVAYVFTRSGSTWTQQQELTASDGAAVSEFGNSVALSGDGSIALIGADNKNIGTNSFQGAVYVFTRSRSTWTQQQELTASDGAAASEFGYSVALSADGNTSLIGELNGKTAYVFTRSGSTWTQQPELTAFDGVSVDGFGCSVALSADDSTALVGASQNESIGAAYVFNTQGTAFTYISDLNWVSATNGWGPVEKDMSNGEQAAGDGHTISLHDIKYAKGLGCHAQSVIAYNLGGQYSRFASDIGLDDEVSGNTTEDYGSVVFQVFGDGVKLYDSGIMTHLSATQHINVSVAGVNTLQLKVNVGSTSNGDHADWAGAQLSY